MVSLQELYHYLKACVGQWVTENRANVQEPMLLPPEADFPVVFRHFSEATLIPSPSAPDPRWKEIGALWERHAQLAAEAPYRTQPLAWAEFQQKLLRLEQLVEAGAAYQQDFNDTRKQAESLADSLGPWKPGDEMAAYSLPLARQFGKWPTAAELEAVPAPWKKPPAGAAAKTPAKAGATKPAVERAAKPDAQYPYLAAASASWQWLCADPSHCAALPAALTFVDHAQFRPTQDLVEVHFLRMLAQCLDPPLWTTSADQVQRGLLARRLAEQAAAPAEPQSYYWIQTLVDQADEDRRHAEDYLLVGSPAALTKADSLWNKAAGEQGEGGDYARAIHRGEEVAAAVHVRDRAWSELPYLAEWILAQPTADASAEDDVRGAIEAVRRLSDQLDEHLADQQWPPPLVAAAAELNSHLQALNDRFQRAVRRPGNGRRRQTDVAAN